MTFIYYNAECHSADCSYAEMTFSITTLCRMTFSIIINETWHSA